MSLTLIERNGQTTCVVPRTVHIGPAKGKNFTERVTKTLRKTFSVLEGTELRHGPFLSFNETETISSVWSSLQNSLVEKKTIFRKDIEKTYANGKLEGEFTQRNWLFHSRNKEMQLVSTITSFYKNGLEDGVRTMKDASGKTVKSWTFKQGKLVE
ncbi:hypothetical protein A9K97_gp266 [Tokyovirus A1]|uniref:hypothetical protein n=1 Tax=Tokyovirus A1 TaxID=1826170 RepID=UPI0007A96842|nr:hypothetical protein A9K97_gp266 [Tokyovirus A1]BAU80085.1 hypothetical protein [Tokyovirus A1]